MPNDYFRFKQFTIQQQHCAMKVTTDGCLFGAWVAHSLAARAPQHLLDIGTGTGLLPLMLAQQVPAHSDAVEIDAAACAQARENAAASPWAARVNVVQADIRQYTPAHPFDVMVSNPPFYETDLAGPDNSRNLAHHSTALTLKELIQFIENYLPDTGSCFLLLPFRRLEEAKDLLTISGLHIRQQVLVRSSEAHAYFRVMLEATKAPQPCITGTLTIYNAQRQYTPAFTQLLQPYYVAL